MNRPRFLPLFLWSLLACAPGLPVWAQGPQMADLPAESAVAAVILARPEVLGATASQRADQAAGDRLRTSPHEYTFKLSAQQRRSTESATSQRFTEPQVAVERTLRLPNKARQDEQLAQATEARAVVRRADAIHEASRTLLRAWYDWQRDRALVGLWQQQLEAQQALLSMAQQRVKAGDAARTELMAQEAAASQLETERLAAQTQEAVSLARLNRHYPGLTAGANGLVQPAGDDLPARPGEDVVRELVTVSHEAQLARMTAYLAQAEARKTELARQVDPTVGVFASRERGGAEQVVGLSLSLPWGGEGRSASARQAWAMAEQAAESARAVGLMVQAEAEAAWLEATGLHKRWQSQEAARQQQEQVLQKTVKGWQLGEFGHADVLQARRQYLEAARAEVLARAEARHASSRLWLDLHTMWEFDEDPSEPPHP